ncbi:MAG: ABC transporter substrate-binding protein [Anaerolineae bacterium]|nr:ABC transporter substrate-binding protein [Anaerolineae bacterium]
MRKLAILGLLALLNTVVLAPRLAQAQNPTEIRLAVIPVLDTLPLFIAQEAGYFEEEGLTVELIPVASPPERDALIQAAEADGMVTDIQGVGFFNEARTRVQVVYTTRVALEDGPVFRILAAPESGLRTPADLEGVSIGVSENTIIEYLTDRLLEAEGVAGYTTEAVPAIPVRFQLLMAGELQAATLPDPLAQAAIEAGAVLIVDDTQFAESEWSQSVLVFRAEFVQEQSEAVAAFIRAWDRAVQDLNADPEAYRAIFLENVPVPETVQETYSIPPFPRGLITSEAAWEDAMAWMLDNAILDEAPTYADSVNPAFLPEIAPEPDTTPEPGS